MKSEAIVLGHIDIEEGDKIVGFHVIDNEHERQKQKGGITIIVGTKRGNFYRISLDGATTYPPNVHRSENVWSPPEGTA